MVAISNTTYNIKNIIHSAYSVFMCFVWFWEQTTITALQSIKRMVFVTRMWSVVFRYLGAESLNAIIKINLSL